MKRIGEDPEDGPPPKRFLTDPNPYLRPAHTYAPMPVYGYNPAPPQNPYAYNPGFYYGAMPTFDPRMGGYPAFNNPVPYHQPTQPPPPLRPQRPRASRFGDACYVAVHGAAVESELERFGHEFEQKLIAHFGQWYAERKKEFDKPPFEGVSTRAMRNGTDGGPPDPAEVVGKAWLAHLATLKKNEEAAYAAQVVASRSQIDAIADGKLVVTSLHVGHGDCTIIRTPAGKIIVIDCGSAGHKKTVGARPHETVPAWKEAIDRVKATMLAKTEVDILILTHADRDHHNKLPDFARDAGITQFNVVYHSDAIADYHDGVGTPASETIRGLTTKSAQIKRVVLNQTMCRIYPDGGDATGTVPPPIAKKGSSMEYLDTDGSLIIHEETDCTVRILASEVDVITDPAHPPKPIPGNAPLLNGASVVTLIESFDEKILICGDATIPTETFLLKTFAARLQSLSLLRVAHHGSDVSCSGAAFIDYVKAKIAVVSTGYNVIGHHFPAIEVLERCWPHTNNDAAAHNIWYFVQHGTAYQHDDLITDSMKRFAARVADQKAYQKKDLWITGSGGIYSKTFDKKTAG